MSSLSLSVARSKKQKKKEIRRVRHDYETDSEDDDDDGRTQSRTRSCRASKTNDAGASGKDGDDGIPAATDGGVELKTPRSSTSSTSLMRYAVSRTTGTSNRSGV